ncbi:thiamine pyrophosphate-binding protein [Flavobacterium sp. JLP]|uniref:thiamine pyrophosphate-binding protein n=1 Tax=Flavobacterium sp. JLP TaxID=2783793 RepID=UPI00188C67AF|nr:thiamine pyrophosphate-binding protein [Flavobacterium sp. JLP]MBF4507178.1 thiamine pyrophosphate-binding protein [Flavobacterium sp. JLP]
MGRLIKVSDLIVNFFEEKRVEHVFLLSGGMMMHLLDSVSKSKKIKYVCNHHEQACSISAEAYARVKNTIGVCYATSGPGATNTVTGIAGAWLDSSPVMFLTGQSRASLTSRESGIDNLRMLGNFEVDISEITKPITKYSFFLNNPKEVLFHLEKAYFLATNGRPGPVLLDIPLDVQGAMVDEDELLHFISPEEMKYNFDLDTLKNDLKNAKQPLIIAGHGIRAANQVEQFRALISHLQIPVVTTQLANDLLPYIDNLYVGKVGLRGDRAGNFAVQTSDLIITIGTSLHITTTGYELESFAPNAKKIVVDIDDAVLEKNKGISNLQIKSDVSTFISKLYNEVETLKVNLWLEKLTKWKKEFLIINEPHVRLDDQINTYHFIDLLSNNLNDDDIVIADSGSLYYITGQALLSKIDQRIILSGALGAMGYALPASIGAAFAAPAKNIICLVGDGSMQLNVQELQTISHYNLNCKIIIINNNGYASIRNSQASFLDGHIAAASQDTGVTFPNWEKLSDAYNLEYIRKDKYSELEKLFTDLNNKKGPVIVEIIVPENVTMIPAVTSVKLPNGSFKSNMLHEMVPELSEEKLLELGISINI